MQKKTKSTSRNKFDKLFWGVEISFGISLLVLLVTFFVLYFSQLSKINEQPIATITFKLNTAQRRLESSAEWDRLQQNSYLYNGDTVYIAEMSQATITFHDGSKMYLDQETMTQIYKKNKSSLHADIIRGNALVYATQNSGNLSLSSGNTTVNVEKDSVVQFDAKDASWNKESESSNTSKKTLTGDVSTVDVSAPEIKVIKGNAKVKGEGKRFSLTSGETLSFGDTNFWKKSSSSSEGNEASGDNGEKTKTDNSTKSSEEEFRQLEKKFMEKRKNERRLLTEVFSEEDKNFLENLENGFSFDPSEFVYDRNGKIKFFTTDDEATAGTASADVLGSEKEDVGLIDVLAGLSSIKNSATEKHEEKSEDASHKISEIESAVEREIESFSSTKNINSDEEIGLIDAVHNYVESKADSDTRPLDQVEDLSAFPRSVNYSDGDTKIKLSWRGVDRAGQYEVTVYAPGGSVLINTTVKSDVLARNFYTLDFSKFNNVSKGTYTWTAQAVRVVDGNRRTGPVSRKGSFDVK